jgi:hypothetical protein
MTRPAPDLFSYAPYNGSPPAQAHSQTSQEAAEKIRHRIGPLHARILDCLDKYPAGKTDEQLMNALDLGGNTLRPRRRELQLMGLLTDSGRTALTRSGRNAVVWVKAG